MLVNGCFLFVSVSVIFYSVFEEGLVFGGGGTLLKSLHLARGEGDPDALDGSIGFSCSFLDDACLNYSCVGVCIWVSVFTNVYGAW